MFPILKSFSKRGSFFLFCFFLFWCFSFFVFYFFWKRGNVLIAFHPVDSCMYVQLYNNCMSFAFADGGWRTQHQRKSPETSYWRRIWQEASSYYGHGWFSWVSANYIDVVFNLSDMMFFNLVILGTRLGVFDICIFSCWI